MKDKKRNKGFVTGQKFLEGINFWHKQISENKNLKLSLKHSKAEIKKHPKKLKEHLETRSSAERMINKQLHHEIEQRKRMEKALQDSETRFRRLFEAAQDGILILDAQTGQIDEVNQFLIDMLGYSHKDFLGKKLWEIGPMKDIKACKDLFSELQHKKYIRYENLPLETKDGRNIDVEFVSNVYGIDHKKVIQCNIRNITERKKVERVMNDALAYTEDIINTVREPLLVLDSDLKVISASRSFYQIFKVKREDTEKQHIYDLGNRQWNIPKLRELLEEILPRAASFDNFEVEHTFPAIGKRTMLLNARKIYRKTNHVQLILLAIEDITKRKEAEEKLRILASHDEITGCLNFRSIMGVLENEIARSKRYQKNFSIIMIDIDQFKRINDEYGHLAGNDAVVAFANILKNNIRNIDIVGRYGGDEFVIVLPESDSRHALAVLERIKSGFSQTKIISPHVEATKELTLHFSAGVAVFPRNAKDLKELIWVADSALRQAKQEGKNRTVLEKRRWIRFKPLLGARIEIINLFGKEDAQALTMIVNVSEKGMLLLSNQNTLNEEFLCRIYCPKGGSPLELTGKVQHKKKSERELYRIGVYFPEIPESMKEKLLHCIESPKELE